MNRLCCLLFALLVCAAEVASAAPAPLLRTVRRPERDFPAWAAGRFAARGIRTWGFMDGAFGLVLYYELPINKRVYPGFVEVRQSRLQAVREALDQIDAFLVKVAQ